MSAMTASWIAYSLLVGVLLGATALGVEALCRMAGRPARWVWAGALALAVALAAMAPHRADPRSVIRLPAFVSVVATATPASPRGPRSVLDMVVRAERGAVAWTQTVLARADRALPAGVDRGLGTLWMLASGALVLLFGAVYLRFARARRRWPIAELHGERVRIAPEAGPAVVGLSQPEIVVPRWLLERSVEEQRLVLVHEREHVLARDPLLLAAACAAAALLPWNPAAWWMLSRLHLAVELDCDDRVLRRGVAPRSYGTLLIDLAGRCSGLPVGAPALADRSSHLERRLLAMLPTRPRLTRVRAALFGSAAALALLAACEAKMPTSAEVDGMDASNAKATAEHMQFMKVGDPNTVYTLDGKTVTAAEANAIAPNQIASVAVEKKNVNGVASSEINIRTRAAMGLPALAEGEEGAHVMIRRDSVVGDAGGVAFKMHGDASGVAVGEEHASKMRNFDGVILLDGVRVDNAKLTALNPSEILSMEVIKGPAASKLFDAPEAANGVIKITTKAAKK